MYEELTGKIIGAAIEVHRNLGPGLLESAYEGCLCHERSLNGVKFEKQRPLPVVYKGIKIDCSYRLHLVVEESVIVEVKAVDAIIPVHEAQLLTYLKLTGIRVGLLINFHEAVLKDGIRSRII
jgi:GxxExxY protein